MSVFGAIVVGGGHAGAEAAHALARLGVKTLLLTMNIDTIGHLSCNPAVGGLGKSQLVREIDALGGIMARVADRAAIQYRRLNMSKGPAVRATRVQCDMRIYRQEMQRTLFQTENLSIKQGRAEQFILKSGRVAGVVTQLGQRFEAQGVVLTTGTFLRGLCHVGLKNFEAGRAGGSTSVGLSEALAQLGLEMGRLKTGTTPRLDGRTIDFSVTEEQPTEPQSRRLSHYQYLPLLEQRSCWMTYTNERTHDIVRAATDQSPLFTGVIEGVGPRYCPSIEDKVVRFPDKHRHLVFLEPQGLDTPEIYPNGLSTSLPLEAQIAYLRSIPGLEQVEITRPGYAVEYDFIQPTQLSPGLELRALPGLFLAGQINGTSGYEEAAAQGLVAGVNLARQLRNEASFSLRRDEAYIGVMIDDLVTKGVKDPYRMFTSRAEFRLLLREDNADQRLSSIGRQLGLLSEDDYAIYDAKRDAKKQLEKTLRAEKVRPTQANVDRAKRLGLGGIKNAISLYDLLRRPHVSVSSACQMAADPIDLSPFSEVVREAVQLEARYAGYVDRQRAQADRLREMESHRIPEDLDYQLVAGLSSEAIEKLSQIAPATLGQAGRISGITPAAVTALLIHLGRGHKGRLWANHHPAR